MILDEININFKPKRKPKYTNDYYLKKILFILKSGSSWRDCTESNIENHYSSIFKKYRQWSNNNIFENVWIKLQKMYKRKRLNKLSKSDVLTVFIDTSSIRNVNGKEIMKLWN